MGYIDEKSILNSLDNILDLYKFDESSKKIFMDLFIEQNSKNTLSLEEYINKFSEEINNEIIINKSKNTYMIGLIFSSLYGIFDNDLVNRYSKEFSIIKSKDDDLVDIKLNIL